MKHICPLESHYLIAVLSVVGKLQDKDKLSYFLSYKLETVVTSNLDSEIISHRNINETQLHKR